MTFNLTKFITDLVNVFDNAFVGDLTYNFALFENSFSWNSQTWYNSLHRQKMTLNALFDHREGPQFQLNK